MSVYLKISRVGRDENLFIFFQNGRKNCRVGTKNQGWSVSGNTDVFSIKTELLFSAETTEQETAGGDTTDEQTQEQTAEQTQQVEGQTEQQTAGDDQGQEKQDTQQVEAEPSDLQKEATQSPQPEQEQTMEQGEAEGQAVSEGQVSMMKI